MKGIFINCPSCKRLLFKDAYIRVGSYFNGTCAKCGSTFVLRAESGKIILKAERTIVVEDDDENDDGVILISS